MESQNLSQKIQDLRQPKTLDQITEILGINKKTLNAILDTLDCATSSINKKPETDYIKTPKGFEVVYEFTRKGIESILDKMDYQENKSKGTKEIDNLQIQYDTLVKNGDIDHLGDKTIPQTMLTKLQFPGFKTKYESEQMILRWWQQAKSEYPKWFKLSSLYMRHMYDYIKYIESKKIN